MVKFNENVVHTRYINVLFVLFSDGRSEAINRLYTTRTSSGRDAAVPADQVPD